LVPGSAAQVYAVFSNGQVQTYALTLAQAASGITSVTVTPTGSGPMQVANVTTGVLSNVVNVVPVLSRSTLSQIQGAVLGSFMWDKAANTLTLYSLTGSVLANYTITEQPTVFSRELLPS
jgi:hypothetical protein